MPDIFLMPPPNDHVNSYGSETLLDEVRLKQPVLSDWGDYQYWPRLCSCMNEAETYIDALEGRMFSLLLRDSGKVVDILEKLMHAHYGLAMRQQLHREIVKVFTFQYKPLFYVNPVDIVDSEKETKESLEKELARLKSAERIVEKHVALIGEWCMADYSTSKLGCTEHSEVDERAWKMGEAREQKMQAMDGINFASVAKKMAAETVADAPKKAPVLQAVLTPEQLRQQKIKRQLDRELKKMKREGKLSADVIETLECNELL